jgi:hypothetical protein
MSVAEVIVTVDPPPKHGDAADVLKELKSGVGFTFCVTLPTGPTQLPVVAVGVTR